MGFKLSTVIIKDFSISNQTETLDAIGFKDLKLNEVKTFDEVMFPDDPNLVFIGQFNNSTIICSHELAFNSFDELHSLVESTISVKFPNHYIYNLALHSVVNYWHYSVIKNGELIRKRAGSAEDGTTLDFGMPLEAEDELLSKARELDSGELHYYLDDEEEPYTEDQVGEEFVFALSEMCLGERIDCSDKIFDVQMQGYSYGYFEMPRNQNTSSKVDQEVEKKKSNWMIIGVIIIVLLAFLLFFIA